MQVRILSGAPHESSTATKVVGLFHYLRSSTQMTVLCDIWVTKVVAKEKPRRNGDLKDGRVCELWRGSFTDVRFVFLPVPRNVV